MKQFNDYGLDRDITLRALSKEEQAKTKQRQRDRVATMHALDETLHPVPGNTPYALAGGDGEQ